MTYTESDYGTRCVAIDYVISSLSFHFKKLYSWPGQKTILKFVEKWCGLKFSLRTLNRDLKRMAKEGWFKRTRRLTRKGINAGRFTSTLYTLKRKVFSSAIRMKKWSSRVLSFSRVPNLANNMSKRENKIFKVVAPNVDNLWKSALEGKPSPV
jgi:hypothetical protein